MGPSQCRPSALLAVALLLLVGAVQSGAQEVATPESTVVQPVHDLSLEAEEELSQNRNDTYLVSNGTVITAEELPAARVDPTEGLPAVLFAETPIPDEIDGPTTIQPVATGAAGVGAGNNATVYTATITEVPTTESVADVITVAPVEEVQISAQNDAQLDNFFATPGADAEMGYDGPAGNDTLAVLEEGLSAINQKAAMDADDGELEHTPVVVTEATEDNEAPVSGETGAINTDKPDDSAPVVADWTGAKDTDAVDEAGDIEGEAEDEEAVILPVMPDMTADEEYAVEEEGVPIKLGEDEELSVYVDFTEGPVVDDIEDEGEAGVAVGESPDGGDGTLSEETVGEDIVKNEEGGDANVAVAGVHTDEGAVEVVTEQGEDDKSTTERNATAGNGADDVMTPVAGGEVIEAVTGTAAPEIVVNGVIDDEGEAEEPIGGEEGEVEGAIVEGGQNVEEVDEGGNADEEGEDRVGASEGEEEGKERQMGAMVDGSNGEDTEEIVVEDEEVLFVGGGDVLEVEEEAEAPAPEGILEGEEVPELTEGALDVAEEAPVETERAVEGGDVVNVGAIDEQAGLAVEVEEEMQESMGTEAPAEGVLADVVVGGTEDGVEAGVKGVTMSGGDVGEVVEGVAETEVVAVTTMPPTRPLMEERSNAVVRAGETADTPEWYPSFLAIEADRHRICRGRVSPSCCADGESSCECAAAAKCVVAVGDPCDHHITASACEDSEDGSCTWSGLHGVCRDASNVCNTLDGEPLQCATTPGCVTEPVCAPACNTCSACFNMALRFADLSRHTTPVDLGPSFTRFCRRQSGHDVDCTAAGRLLDSEPGLLGRQLALCSAADACSGTCAASSAEVLESLGATDAIAAAGSALCLDAWGWDSAGAPNLPATAASRIALEPVNAAGVASDGPVNSGCVSAWDCDAGLQCSPSDCDVDIMCEAVTGRDATTTCPLQCAKPLPVGCDEANELNESICTSDVDCDDGLTCTAVNSCQIYACDDMGVMSVDTTCDKRCLEPATVLDAAFSGNDLRNVDILLSQPALPVIDAPCNAIFANVSLPQLGHAPRCSIRGEKLTVSLGVGASLSPEAGSAEIVPLTLSESQTAVRSALAVDGALFTGSVTSVSFPSPNGLPSPPIALLTGPVTVPEGGYCGDDNDLPAGLVLDASQSVAHSAGPLNTAWSLATFPEGVNTSVLLSRVADATGSKLLLFGVKELIAMLPGDYTFTVSVRDAVGRTSTATHALKVVPRGAVILPEVALPARVEFDPDTGLRVAADLDSTFACGVLDSIRFTWKDESLSTSNDPLLAFWGASGLRLDSLELFIPPSLTSAVPTDDTRKFSFTVTAGNNVTSRTTVEVSSVRKPPPVILSGPSGDVGVGMAVEFRAMALRAGELVPAAELASVAPVSYTCRHLPDGAPCVGANGRQPLQSGQDLVLPTGLVAANHSYEVCLEDPVEGVQNWLACKTISALAEGSAPLGGIDPVCDGALALSHCLDAHPSAAPLRFHAWVVADDTALRWWSPQVELVAGENCNALNNSRLVIASDALPVGGRFEVKLNLTRGGVTAVSSVDVLIDEAPTCVFDECMSLSTEADRVVITAPGWADREGEPLRYEFGEVARNGAVMLPHAPPTHRPFFVLNTPLAAQSSEEVAHTFYVCAIDERNGRSCVISVLSVSGSRLSTQDTIAASVDKAFRTSHVSPVPLIAAARQVEAARVKLTAARVARALAVLADAAGVPAAGGAQLPVSFESLSNSARAASALLSINELPCGPVSQRVVDMASKYAEAVASDAATCVSVGSVADGLTLMGGAVATAARAECRQPVTGRRPTPSQVYTLDSVINRQAPRLAAAGRNCATEDDGPVIISSSTAGDGKSRLLSGMFRVNELTATGLKLPVDDAERASSPRRHHSRRILLEQDAPAHIDATVRVAFPGGFPLACAADPICEGVIPVSVLHSESVAALMEAISGGYWRSFSGAVLVETEGVVGGNVTVQIPLFVGSSYEAVACVALNRTTGQFVEIEMTGVTISSINCSVIPGSIVMMAASRVTPPASGDEGSEAAFEVPESPTQDEVQTSIQNLTRKWEAMPLWQKIVIPVSLVILLLLCCACGVGIFCMCCKRRSSKAANNGKKPKDVYQFSVSSAPAAAAQKTPKDRGQAISNPVFDAPGGGDAASTGRRRSAGLNSTFDSEGTLSPARTSVNTSPDRTQNAAGFGTGAGTRRPSTTSSPIRRVSGGHGSPGRASGSKSGPSHGGRRSFRAKGHTTWSSNNAENI